MVILVTCLHHQSGGRTKRCYKLPGCIWPELEQCVYLSNVFKTTAINKHQTVTLMDICQHLRDVTNLFIPSLSDTPKSHRGMQASTGACIPHTLYSSLRQPLTSRQSLSRRADRCSGRVFQAPPRCCPPRMGRSLTWPASTWPSTPVSPRWPSRYSSTYSTTRTTFDM